MIEFNNILKELNKHKWWVEEAPAVIQTIAYPLTCFVKQSSRFHPKYLSIAILGFRNSHFYEITPEDEKLEIYYFFFNKMKEDANYLSNARKENEESWKEILRIVNTFSKEKLTNKQLCKSYEQFMQKYIDFLLFNAAIECSDMITTYYLRDMVKKELPNCSQDELTKIIIDVTSPKELSFMEDERISFLTLCLENYEDIRDNKLTIRLKEQLKKHSQRFYFVLNNFKEVKELDSNYFLEKAKEETDKEKLKHELDGLRNKAKKVEENQKEIFKKYNFSEDIKLHFKVVSILGESIDERKEKMLTATHFIFKYCSEIAKRFNIELTDILDCTYEEIIEMLLKNKKPDKTLVKKRRELSIFAIKKEGAVWLFDKEAEAILDKALPKASDEITGQVASAPVDKISGKVQVIFDVSEKDFKEGNILVTTMTRPEFVPLMRKASAVITDEGGITSHAAIISRELRIPCIIGTKIATKALKDGDLVEVDVKKGIVKILKK
jgi:phosphohistidine swiveling domain-containing protein